MLEQVKLALRVSTSLLDAEIQALIAAALADLGIAGVEAAASDPLILRAVITYCRANFTQTDPQNYDRMKASYDEQKAQLSMATGYTDWLDGSGRSGCKCTGT